MLAVRTIHAADFTQQPQASWSLKIMSFFLQAIHKLHKFLWFDVFKMQMHGTKNEITLVWVLHFTLEYFGNE